MNSPNMCRRLRRLRRKLSLAGLVRYRVCNLRRKKKLMADETCCHPRVPLKPLEIDTLGKVAVSMVILVIVASVVAQIAVLRLSNKPGQGDGNVLQVRARTLEAVNPRPAEINREGNTFRRDRFHPPLYGYVVDGRGLKVPLTRLSSGESPETNRLALESWEQDQIEFGSPYERSPLGAFSAAYTSWEAVHRLLIRQLERDALLQCNAEAEVDLDGSIPSSGTTEALSRLMLSED